MRKGRVKRPVILDVGRIPFGQCGLEIDEDAIFQSRINRA
jgi:hypothetical protein